MELRAIVACAALGAVVVSAALDASAQSRDLAEGREAFSAARFSDAAEAFDRVLRDAASSTSDLVEAHRHLAVLRGAAGDMAGSQGHVDAALAVYPAAIAPEGASPDVVAAFGRARAARGGRRARVGLSLPRQVIAGRVSLARVAAADVPASLGAHVNVRCSSEAAVVASRDAPAAREPTSVSIDALPAGAVLSCSATLVTREGVVLDRMDDSIAVTRGPSGSPVAIYLLAGAGAVLLGTIITLLVVGGPEGTQEARLGVPRILP